MLHYASKSSVEILESVWNKVSKGKDSAAGILLNQNEKQENFLHIFLSRNDIESSEKIEFFK